MHGFLRIRYSPGTVQLYPFSQSAFAQCSPMSVHWKQSGSYFDLVDTYTRMLPDRAMTTPMTKTMHPIDASDTWREQRAYKHQNLKASTLPGQSIESMQHNASYLRKPLRRQLSITGDLSQYLGQGTLTTLTLVFLIFWCIVIIRRSTQQLQIFTSYLKF